VSSLRFGAAPEIPKSSFPAQSKRLIQSRFAQSGIATEASSANQFRRVVGATEALLRMSLRAQVEPSLVCWSSDFT
jgi:DnaJ-domain-containing protein 1